MRQTISVIMRRMAGTPTLVMEPSRWLFPVLHSLGTIPARQAILRRLGYRFQSSTWLWSWTRLLAPAPLGRGPLQPLAWAALAFWIFSSKTLSRSTQLRSISKSHSGTTRCKEWKAFGRHQFCQLPKPWLNNRALPWAPSRLRSSTNWSCCRLTKRARSCSSLGTRTNCKAASFAIEVIAQIARQGPAVDGIVLAPLPFLLRAIGGTDQALGPAGRQLPVEPVTKRACFVDDHHLLGELKLLVYIKRHLGFVPQVLHRSNRGVVDLAGGLIVP